MRILHVIQDLAPGSGGPVEACLGMARAMRRRGHEVIIHTTNWDRGGFHPTSRGEAAGVEGIAIHRHRVQLHGPWPLSLPLARALGEAVPKADAVHVHALYLFHDLVAWRLCRRHGVPYIVQPHGSLDPYIHRRHRWRKALVERLFQNRMLRDAAAIHYTAEEEMRLAAPYAQGAPGAVVPLGLEPADYGALPPTGRFRAAYPTVGGRPIILFLGRLHAKKGFDILVPAFSRLLRAGFDAQLVIAGPDYGMRKRIEAWVRAQHVADRVTFTGMLRGEEKLAALVDADLFVLPSYSENFGIAVIEALACGLPVLISDRVNIWREIVEDGGGRATPCDAEAFGEALMDTMGDPEALAAMAAAGPATVARRYAWDKVAVRLEALYRRVAAGSGV